jgi:hypothetical protein
MPLYLQPVVIAAPSLWYSGSRGESQQLGMEAEVRRLLRRAYDPFRLGAFPLAQALCEVTGIANPEAALRHVIDKAFQEDWQEERLRHLLLPPDKGSDGTRREAAQRLQISTRHIQRRRAKAVSILALHIRKLVGAPPSTAAGDRERDPDPLETIAEIVSDIEPDTAANIFRLGNPQSAARANLIAMRACVDAGAEVATAGAQSEPSNFSPLVAILRAQSKELGGKPDEAARELLPLFTRAARDRATDPEARFELEWLEFLRARQRGSAPQMQRVATNLERVADGHSAWLGRALRAAAEARIRCGRLQDAAALLEEADRYAVRSFAVRQLASSSVLKAEIAFQSGDAIAAERLATGAYMILRGRHRDAYRCQTIVARARLRLGKPWTCPEDAGNLSTATWDGVAVQIECARHLANRGRGERARKQSTAAYEAALTLKYGGLAARAAAAVGATFGKGTPQRRDWYLRALAALLATRDRSIACDLFVREKGRGDMGPFEAFDTGVSEMLYAGLQSAIPHLRRESQAQSRAARAFLKHLGTYVLGFTPLTRELDEAIATVASSGSFAQYMLHFLDDATDVLEVAFAATVAAAQRPESDRRLTAALRAFAQAVRPREDIRAFLVG